MPVAVAMIDATIPIAPVSTIKLAHPVTPDVPVTANLPMMANPVTSYVTYFSDQRLDFHSLRRRLHRTASQRCHGRLGRRAHRKRRCDNKSSSKYHSKFSHIHSICKI